MRPLFTCIAILIFTFSCVGQENNWQRQQVFKVLFAENAVNKSGQAVKTSAIIQRDDLINIHSNGSLVLIHRLGFPVEINHQASLRIDSLDSLVLKTLNQKPVKKKRVKDEDVAYRNSSKIDYLFITTVIAARKRRLELTGSCMDCNPDMEITFPIRNQTTIYYDDELCLKWRPTSSSLYQVAVTNEFDEVLKSVNTESNQLSISGRELDSLRRKSELLILQITDRGIQDSRMRLNQKKEFVIRKFIFSGLPLPYSCDFSNAPAALLYALSVELDNWRELKSNSDLALEYYQLATKLSDNEFYKEMLSNFEKRKK